MIQVRISVVGEDKMRISWITEASTPASVQYGTSPGKFEFSADGTTASYSYLTYESGEIHDTVIGPLKPNSVYYYRCGLDSTREFSFKTPPARFPVKFAIVGMYRKAEYT